MDRYVLLVLHSGHDRHGVDRAYVHGIAAGLLRHGYRPMFVDLAGCDGEEELARQAQLPEVAFVYSDQAHGLAVAGGQDRTLLPLAEWSGKPVISMVRDRPLIPRIVRNLRQPTGSAHVYHVDEQGPVDAAPRLASSPKRHRFHHSCYLEAEDVGQQPLSYAQCPIDLLYVASWSDPELWRTAFQERHADTAGLLDAAIDRCSSRRERSVSY